MIVDGNVGHGSKEAKEAAGQTRPGQLFLSHELAPMSHSHDNKVGVDDSAGQATCHKMSTASHQKPPKRCTRPRVCSYLLGLCPPGPRPSSRVSNCPPQDHRGTSACHRQGETPTLFLQCARLHLGRQSIRSRILVPLPAPPASRSSLPTPRGARQTGLSAAHARFQMASHPHTRRSAEPRFRWQQQQEEGRPARLALVELLAEQRQVDIACAAPSATWLSRSHTR